MVLRPKICCIAIGSAQIQDENGFQDIRNQILISKTIDWLQLNAKVEETTVAAADKIETVTHLLAEMIIKRSIKKQFKKRYEKHRPNYLVLVDVVRA